MKRDRNSLEKIIGSLFFLGKIKGGGTYSSFITAFLLFLFLDWSSLYYFIIGFVLILLSFLLSLRISEDPTWFTLDEVSGTIVTFAFHGKSLSVLILGLVLFRFFDIFKIPPLKKIEHLKGGIVLDDIFAGILASIFLFVLDFIKSLYG
ncbi:MAG: phosphatidylglycerophosphatase A [candidate division WOR-3 bacterium]